MRETSAEASVTKPRESYHHGALREGLINAAYALVSEAGTQGFSMADAARRLGVSSAAPYRHFADSEALLTAACGRAFEAMTARLIGARDHHERGSIEAIITMGQAYVGFVVENRYLFELMWSRHLDDVSTDEMTDVGRRCFGTLLDAVDAYRARHGILTPGTREIAVPLWVMVHGTASLVLGRNVDVVAPGINTDEMLDAATRAYFAGLKIRQRDPVDGGIPEAR